jgi:hypothetical protein
MEFQTHKAWQLEQLILAGVQMEDQQSEVVEIMPLVDREQGERKIICPLIHKRLCKSLETDKRITSLYYS